MSRQSLKLNFLTCIHCRVQLGRLVPSAGRAWVHRLHPLVRVTNDITHPLPLLPHHPSHSKSLTMVVTIRMSCAQNSTHPPHPAEPPQDPKKHRLATTKKISFFLHHKRLHSLGPACLPFQNCISRPVKW